MTSTFTTPFAAALVALASSAQAQDVGRGDKAVPASAPIATPGPWQAAPVASARLATLRGGTSLSANATLNGSLQDTNASNVQTGANTVGGGSFANASGLPTVIQNSGANVVIQNSTIVNVLFKP